MSAKPILYYRLFSPPCRSVILTAAALGVGLELKVVDLFGSKEHLKPEFLKVSVHVTIDLSFTFPHELYLNFNRLIRNTQYPFWTTMAYT